MENDRPSPQDSGELTTPAIKARGHLDDLLAERAQALLDDRDASQTILAIDATRAAYVGAAVTELACLRASFDGPLHG